MCTHLFFLLPEKTNAAILTDLVLLFVFFIEEMSGKPGGGLYPAPPREVTTSSSVLPIIYACVPPPHGENRYCR